MRSYLEPLSHGAIVGLCVMIVVITPTMLPSTGYCSGPDPLPSPLYKSSLGRSVEQMTSLGLQLPEAVPPVAMLPPPGRLTPDFKAVSPQKSASAIMSPSSLSIEDCFLSNWVFGLSDSATDVYCTSVDTSVGQGTAVMARSAPPYTNGYNIPTELIGLNLQSSTPFGLMHVRERVDRRSTGEVIEVVTDGSGNLTSGWLYFDAYLEFEFVSLGITVNTGNQSIRLGTDFINALPPIGSTLSMPSGQSYPLFDTQTEQLVRRLCYAEVSATTTLSCSQVCWCIWMLVCASGPASELAQLGVCVGDRRRSDPCSCFDPTCAELPTKVGNVSLLWQFVACEPSTDPLFSSSGVFSGSCTSGPTMPTSPSCPGEASCPGMASCDLSAPTCGTTPSCPNVYSCPGTISCPGTSSCPGTASCPSTPSCPGVSSCPGFGPTCPWGPTCSEELDCFYWTSAAAPTCGGASCHESPSCYGSVSCVNTPSCPSTATCLDQATCTGYGTCSGSATCGDFPSCATVLEDYSIVFSVEGPVNAAEGLLTPGNPEPNDLFALGPFGGYFVEGELFQGSSSFAVLDNVVVLSSALGVSPGGTASYRGPYAPNAGAAAPVPAPPGGLGTLGLLPGDDLDALSFGNDGGNILLFSVSPLSVGVPGTDVYFQTRLAPVSGPIGPFPPGNGGGDPGDEAAGDIFASSVLSAAGAAGTGPTVIPAPPSANSNKVGDVSLGLQAPAINWAIPLGSAEDDLDALEASDASVVDPDLDGIPNNPVYFSLDDVSGSVLSGLPDPFPGVSTGPDPDGITPDDILVSPPPGGSFFSYAIFARGILDIGLLDGDELDALALYDSPPKGVLSVGDEILFSLAGGSPSLTPGANPNMPAGPLSPADVYRRVIPGIPGAGPSQHFATAAELGLLPTDEVDAIDLAQCKCSNSPDADLDGISDLCDVCPTPAAPLMSVPVRTGGVTPRELVLTVGNDGRFWIRTAQSGLWRLKDSSSSIFDATLLLAHGVQGGDPTVFHRFFDRWSNGQYGFRPIAPLQIDSTAYGTGAGYVRVFSRMVSKDCRVGVNIDWAFPQALAEDEFILVKYSVYSYDGSMLSDLAAGALVDFDVVPAKRYGQLQLGVTNTPGADAIRQLTWQRGTDTAGHIPVGLNTATRYRAGLRVFGPWQGTAVGNNPDDLWPGGGPSDAFLYDKLTTLNGIDLFSDYASDLYTIAVFDNGVTLMAFDTARYCFTLISDTLNEASFKAASDNAAAVAQAWFCPPCACDCHGDPRCDAITDILDVALTINTAFRGGAAIPDPNEHCPYETTDVNCSGSTDIIDVSKMINVAFRGASMAAEFCNPCP